MIQKTKQKPNWPQQATYKDLILCALNRVFGFKERESNEESGDDIQSEFGQQVRGVSPVTDDLTLPKSPQLVRPRR